MAQDNQGFRPAPRPKGPLDNRKLNLFAKCPTAEGRTSILTWALVDNNPHIVVITNDPDEKNADMDWGKIKAALDMPVFFAFLQAIRDVVQHDGETKMKVLNRNFTFYGGRRSEKPEVVTELWVGKDKEGRIWISVIDAKKQNRPKIRFFFECPSFHGFVNSDGSPANEGKVSQLFAMGYVELLQSMYAHMAVINYVDVEAKREARQNQKGGNYGNRGGNGGHNNGSSRNDSAPASSGGDLGGDDFPF